MPSNERDYAKDDDSDRPRRRKRRDDGSENSETDDTKSVSILGLMALIGGTASLLLSFVPCIGALAVIGGVVNLLGGILALVLAKNWRQGTGIPISSIVVSTCALLIGGAWALFLYALKDSKPPVVDDGTVITIAARDLDREYDVNELAADKKYKNRTLEVTGRVHRITRDKPGKITVELDGAAGSTVDCHFDKWDKDKQNELAAIKEKDEVTIRGTCKGRVDTFVTLDSCSLVRDPQKPDPKQPDPQKPIPVTAEELEKAYDENAVGADEKYKGKTLEVTGKFVRVTKDRPSKAVLELEAELGSVIECEFSTAEQAALAKLAASDRLVIQGVCRGTVDGVVTLNNCTLVKKLEKPALGPPMVVSAETLATAYEKNSVSADAKYKGKHLEITGTVRQVSQDRGKITVSLGSEDRGVLVLCDFTSKEAKSQLEKVDVGDKITLRGVCRGGGDGLPVLEDCTLVKPKKGE